MPKASSCLSSMQQTLPRLALYHLVQDKALPKAMRSTRAVRKYRRPLDAIQVHVIAFSDAAFNIEKNTSYGQKGFVNRIYFNDDARTLHFID